MKRNKRLLSLFGILAVMIGLPLLFKGQIIDFAIKKAGEKQLTRFRSELLTDGKLHVLMVGTGSPQANKDRAESCVAIIADGEFFLIDIGGGASEQTDLMNLPLSQLGTIFITHFHSDHFADLPLIANNSWRFGREQPLLVYGPENTSKMVEAFNQAYQYDRAHREENQKGILVSFEEVPTEGHDIKTPRGDEKVLVHEFSNGLKVYAFNVSHEPVEPAFGYRIEYKGKVVIVSGDTKFTENMITHSQEADLLIHEVFNKNLMDRMLALTTNVTGKDAQNMRKLAKSVQKYHSQPLNVAKVAQQAKVKKLVLTHIDPPMEGTLQRYLVLEPFLLEGIADIYKGEIVIAEDGMQFEFE